MLSIITINYNNKEGLKRTIESVINQTNTNYEFIIIDGGSTDGSIEIIHQYKTKITYWISEKDEGIYNAMNKGIVIAQGDYCNFLNSGDTFFSNNVVENFFHLRCTEDICIGNAYFHNGKKHIGTWHSPQIYNMSTIYQITPNHQAAFIKLSLMKKYQYDESLKIVADMDFFIKVLIKDNCSYRKLPFIVVRYDGSGVSSSKLKDLNREKKEVYLRYLPIRVLSDYEEIKKKKKENGVYKYITYIETHSWLSKIAFITLYLLALPVRFENRFFKNKTIS